MVEKSSIHDDAINIQKFGMLAKKQNYNRYLFEKSLCKTCRQNSVVSGYEDAVRTTLSLYNVLVPQYCVLFLQNKSMEFGRFDHQKFGFY